MEIPEKNQNMTFVSFFLGGRTYHAFAIWFPASGPAKFNNDHGGD
jgi:hypothetical protein